MEEKIFIKNKKGLNLAALVYWPKGMGPFPFVVILVGFTGYKEQPRDEVLAKSLARAGIGSIRFDPSGYGESEGILEKDYRFSNYVGDAQVVFDYINELDRVDRARIGVFGESMGGVQALILSKNNASSIHALVLVSSPIIMGSDDDLKGKYKTWEKDGYLERLSSKYGKFKVPFEFIQDARQWDGLDYLKDLKIPILVMWGTKDINVPPSVTKRLFDSATGPKEYKVLEGADHFLNRDPNMFEVMAGHVVDFYSRKLIV